MKRLFNALILAIVLLLIAGCAGPIPYQKAEGQDGFGYSDYHEKDNIYHVTFTAKPGTDMEEVVRLFNRRAKEVCAENGYEDYQTLADPGERNPTDLGGRSGYMGTLTRAQASGDPFAQRRNLQVSHSVDCLKKSK
jgi:hypothetical protein